MPGFKATLKSQGLVDGLAIIRAVSEEVRKWGVCLQGP